jgi:hypothetical protein
MLTIRNFCQSAREFCGGNPAVVRPVDVGVGRVPVLGRRDEQGVIGAQPIIRLREDRRSIGVDAARDWRGGE